MNESKVVLEYENDMDEIDKNIEEYNTNNERKILIILLIWLLMYLVIKNLATELFVIATELFIRGRKINIFLVLITQSYFVVPKNIKINFTHYFIMKASNKRQLQQIAFSHSSDFDFIDFLNLYKKCTSNPYSFLAIDATLASDNPLRFRRNLLEIK